MAPPTPATSPLVDEVIAHAARLSNALNPQTKAYHKIWLEGQQIDLEENKSFVDRAPKDVVELNRQRQKNFTEQLAKLKQARGQL